MDEPTLDNVNTIIKQSINCKAARSDDNNNINKGENLHEKIFYLQPLL